MRYIQLVGLSLGLLLLGGCQIGGWVQETPDEVITEHLGKIPTPRHHSVLLAEEAFLNEQGKLYFKYSETGSFGHRFYAAVHERKDLNLPIHYDWLPVYHLDNVSAVEFEQNNHEPVAVLDLRDWQSLTADVVVYLAPKENNTAVLLNHRDREDVIMRDGTGEVSLIDLVDKPAGVKLVKNLRYEEMSAQVLSVLSDRLHQLTGGADYILLSNGESGRYARPFVFINLKQKEMSYYTFADFTFGSMPNTYLGTARKAGWHFFRSYGLELVERPVSSVSRLLFFLSDTVVDAAHGTTIRAWRMPTPNAEDIPAINESEQMDLAAFEDWLDFRFCGRKTFGEVELLMDGDEFFPRLVDAIIEADESVKLRTYIFDRDDFALRMADLLKRRSYEVDVQVMLDGLGTIWAQQGAPGMMPDDFEAPYGITLYLKEDSAVRVMSLTNPWFAGDHTKTTIIDSDQAFIGGMNIGRQYRWEWHDMMMEVTGDVVGVIEDEFNKTWALGRTMGDWRYPGYVVNREQAEETKTGYPLRILKTLPRHSQIFQAQLEAIRRAKKYIYVQNAYLANNRIVFELAKARLRGVDVRVIIPLDGNHGIMNASNVVSVNHLLRAGVRVFAYPGMSHVKAAIFDDWVCMGSANFDKLSLRVNKEMNIAGSHPDLVKEVLEDVFKRDFKVSTEITKPLPAGWYNTFASIIAGQL